MPKPPKAESWSGVANKQESVANVLVQTALNLKHQAEILHLQSLDLMRDAGRIRQASKNIREAAKQTQPSRKRRTPSKG